ncbi:MAG TPA: DUF5302 domain-containing protein [Nocardioidaceae bacterium]|jgi:hypothetical protein
MSAEQPDEPANDDVKAKMREALSRKQSHDAGVEQRGHGKKKAPHTHGPLGGKREFRRKSG